MQGVSRDSLASARERLDALAGDQDAAAMDVVSEQLAAVVVLLSRQAALRRALSDPALSAEAKQGLVETLFGERLQPPAMDMLTGLVGSRWSRAADLVDAIEALAVQAAFTVAEAEDGLDEVEDELFRFGRIVDRAPRLRSALTDPALPDERKRDLLHALLEDKVSAVTLRLVDNVVLAPRGRVVDRAIEDLAEQAARRRERVIAAVRVAVPLSQEQHERLSSILQAEFGHAVGLRVEVDPSVQGGVVVRMGDQIVDGSIARRLAEARRRLAG